MAETHEYDVRKPMKQADWEKVEEYYLEKVSDITLPEDINPSDLIELNQQLSQLYTEARFDYMYLKRQFEKMKRQMKRAEKQAYMAIKGLGKNEKEREGLINEYLENNKLFGYPVTMFDAIDIYEERVFFMDAVLDDIRDKSGRLISDNGALKLDAEFDR